MRLGLLSLILVALTIWHEGVKQVVISLILFGYGVTPFLLPGFGWFMKGIGVVLAVVGLLYSPLYRVSAYSGNPMDGGGYSVARWCREPGRIARGLGQARSSRSTDSTVLPQLGGLSMVGWLFHLITSTPFLVIFGGLSLGSAGLFAVGTVANRGFSRVLFAAAALVALSFAASVVYLRTTGGVIALVLVLGFNLFWVVMHRTP